MHCYNQELKCQKLTISTTVSNHFDYRTVNNRKQSFQTLFRLGHPPNGAEISRPGQYSNCMTLLYSINARVCFVGCRQLKAYGVITILDLPEDDSLILQEQDVWHRMTPLFLYAFAFAFMTFYGRLVEGLLTLLSKLLVVCSRW